MELNESSSDKKISAPIDLFRVRQLFDRPEKTAESGFLRREVAGRMHERLSLVRLAPKRVLDAGCGSGEDFPILQKHYPQTHVVGLDASTGMISSAKTQQRSASSSMRRLLGQWLPDRMSATFPPGASLSVGNFATLPFAAASFDLVWSNLALHWHPQPDKVFAEWRRALRTDGLLMFSCFGPDTFKELRSASVSANIHQNVLPFVDMHDFGDMLVKAGFATPVMDMETITVTYPSVEKLLADVRAWGGNPLLTRMRGLTGKKKWRDVTDSLENLRYSKDLGVGVIPLTFEVIYGHAFRPASRTTSAGESIVRFDPQPKQG